MNMKKLMTTLMILLLVPFAAMAMDHGKMDDDKKMDHGKMATDKAMDHGKMDMNGMDHDMSAMMMLDSEEVDGVKAMFHLSDVSKEMAKAGQPFTHHLMANFVDLKSGEAIEKGQVAVKVKTPAGVVGKAQMMMGMDGHFGIDLVLDQKGTYNFNIATKLEDGKKRKFHPQHKFK